MAQNQRSASTIPIVVLPFVLLLWLFVGCSESFSSVSTDAAGASRRDRHRLRMNGNGNGNANGNDNGSEPDASARSLFAGFDLGTSGCRVSIIEPLPGGGFREVYNDSVTWSECGNDNDNDNDEEGKYDDPESWWTAIETLLRGCSSSSSPSLLESIASICVSGTSASCLMVDRTNLRVTRRPRMYDYDVLTRSDNESDNGNDNENDDSYESCGERAVELLQKHLPPKHTARSSTGSFAKLVEWILRSPLQNDEILCHQSDYVSTKFMSASGAMEGGGGRGGATPPIQSRSDWQNCLKLGYDVRNLCWPLDDWMEPCLREAMAISNAESDVNAGGISGNDGDEDKDEEDPVLRVLPARVVSPGAPLGNIDERVAEQLGLSKNVLIVGGTTDSNAAFYAAAASGATGTGGGGGDAGDAGKITIPYGTAVTSLGSTTAIKFLSKTYVEDSTLGVYSHRFPMREVFSTEAATTTATATTSDDGEETECTETDGEEAWLVGGASNVGCAVFRALGFTDDELNERSADMDPSKDSDAYLRYKYYPLLPNKVGERFPMADPNKQSVLEPLPGHDDDKDDDDKDGTSSGDARTEYLKGLFQSIATEVECKGYQVLRDLGASPPFPTMIATAGGGSKNPVWTSLRQRIINEGIDIDIDDGADADAKSVTVRRAEQSEASYGAALLAAAGFRLRE